MNKKYYIDVLENGKIHIVKVLNEYDTKEEAKKDLFKLSTGEKKENELLNEYNTKDVI